MGSSSNSSSGSSSSSSCSSSSSSSSSSSNSSSSSSSSSCSCSSSSIRGTPTRPLCIITKTIRNKIANETNSLYLTTFTFKDHILTTQLTKSKTKITIIYNHSLWMTRYWIQTHTNPPKLKEMM